MCQTSNKETKILIGDLAFDTPLSNGGRGAGDASTQNAHSDKDELPTRRNSGGLFGLMNVPYLSSTVHTAYSVIGYSAKSDIVSTLGWYRIPYTNNYWI